MDETALDQDLPSKNPYDFRNPVRPELLVGREDEIAEIERHLKSTAEGRPVHIALLGERAAGKTSLLRTVERRAKKQKLLPVRLDLDAAVTENAFAFFKAVFEHSVQALVEANCLSTSDPRYIAWRRQLYAGDVNVDPEQELLTFGLLAAGAMQRPTVPDVSPGLLKVDCERVADIARAQGWAGVVLMVDEGDLIGENDALVQKLRNLVQSTTAWMLVLVGTHRMFGSLREVFSPIPRQFVRINVDPFSSLGEVYDCIARPLEPGAGARLEPSIVRDIFEVTFGRPYEIQLVCYHIWEAIQSGAQTEFEVSDVVLDNVLKELVSMGNSERQIDADELDIIRRLHSDEFELAIDLLPFERHYTLDEHTLAALFPADFDEETYKAKRGDLDRVISRLQELGVIERVGERFRLAGGAFARVYLKFAARHHAEKHAGHDSNFEQRYSVRLVMAISEWLQRDLLGDGATEDYVAQAGSRHEMTDLVVDRRIKSLIQGAESGDLARVASARVLSPLHSGRHSKRAKRAGVVLSGMLFGVSVEKLEHALIFYNSENLSVEEWRDAFKTWFAARKNLLAKYMVTVDAVYTAVLDEQMTDDLFTYVDSGTAPTRVLQLWDKGSRKEAEEYALRVVRLLELSLPPAGTRDRVAALALRVLYDQAGFMALARGDVAAGRERLDRNEAMSEAVNEQPGWVHHFNYAVMLATTGEFAEAAARAEISQKLLRAGPDGQAWMLAFITRPGGSEKSNLAYGGHVQGIQEILDYVEIHELVYRANTKEPEALEQLRERDNPHGLFPTALVLGSAVHALLGDEERVTELLGPFLSRINEDNAEDELRREAEELAKGEAQT